MFARVVISMFCQSQIYIPFTTRIGRVMHQFHDLICFPTRKAPWCEFSTNLALGCREPAAWLSLI